MYTDIDKYKIALSYSSFNKEQALEIKLALSKLGLKESDIYYYPERKLESAGKPLKLETINTYLSASKTLVIISEHYFQSEICRYEWELIKAQSQDRGTGFLYIWRLDEAHDDAFTDDIIYFNSNDTPNAIAEVLTGPDSPEETNAQTEPGLIREERRDIEKIIKISIKITIPLSILVFVLYTDFADSVWRRYIGIYPPDSLSVGRQKPPDDSLETRTGESEKKQILVLSGVVIDKDSRHQIGGVIVTDGKKMVGTDSMGGFSLEYEYSRLNNRLKLTFRSPDNRYEELYFNIPKSDILVEL